MTWKTKEGGSKAMNELSNEELKDASKVCQNRCINRAILKDQFNTAFQWMKVMTLYHSSGINNYVEFLNIISSNDPAKKNLKDLQFSIDMEIIKLINPPSITKALRNDKFIYNQPFAVMNLDQFKETYEIEKSIYVDLNLGISEGDYLTLITCTAETYLDLTKHEVKVYTKSLDFWMSRVEKEYDVWYKRYQNITTELVKRGLELKFEKDFEKYETYNQKDDKTKQSIHNSVFVEVS